MNQTKQEAAEAYLNRIDPGEDFTRSENEIGSAAFTAGAEWAELSWIPVTERLPEELQPVLFKVLSADKYYDGKVLGGWYTGSDFVTPGSGWVVSHWCPIPDSLLNFKL